MKRLSIIFAVLIATLASSCKDVEVDENALNYQYVYYGIQLYGSAKATNTVAMDGVNVAIRLGLLLDQIAEEGYELADGTDTFESYTNEDEEEITPDWGDLSEFEDEYSYREFLIGKEDYVTITKNGNIYTIVYNYDKKTYGHSGGYFDINYRIGTYEIDTNGVSLSESTSSNTWTITNSDDVNLGSTKSITPSAICTAYSSNIWHAGNGRIEFGLSSTITTDEDADDDDSAEIIWSNFDDAGSLTFKGYDSDDEDKRFLLEDIINDEIAYTFFGGGTSGDLSTEYETTSPVIYDYSRTIYGAIDGEVKASIASDTGTYSVKVEFGFSEEYIFNYTYHYNGYSYIDSFYFY